MTNALRFEVTDAGAGGRKAIVPIVDGRPLLEIVEEFEGTHGLVSPLFYAALEPRSLAAPMTAEYWYGDMSAYGTILLGCECGDADCWPLFSHITAERNSVKWSTFSQPNRDNWDYDFGPFVFDRSEYEAAVASLAPLFDAESEARADS